MEVDGGGEALPTSLLLSLYLIRNQIDPTMVSAPSVASCTWRSWQSKSNATKRWWSSWRRSLPSVENKEIAMNPLQPSDELYFQISPDNYYSLPIQTTPENQILHDPVMDGSGLIPCTSQKGNKGKQREKLPSWGTEKITTIDENKKWMHRETEKQRRQEMARLYTTFRSLLPLEYIKGKRSISDHMHEGTNYIKDLQNKVKQLQAKRDKLMKLSNLSPVGSESGRFTTHLPICVIVHPYSGGLQIKCSYSFRKYGCPLSRVLDVVLKEGLDVVNCISTKTDDMFIHTIRSEDPHVMAGTIYTELQRKLIEAISSSSSEERLSEPENC
ncbi:Transcription factor bHLH36 [Spatholobus suberectus]|nr:Transcription factor bHLH36 [Spatholobus suberectus]